MFDSSNLDSCKICGPHPDLGFNAVNIIFSNKSGQKRPKIIISILKTKENVHGINEDRVEPHALAGDFAIQTFHDFSSITKED